MSPPPPTVAPDPEPKAVPQGQAGPKRTPRGLARLCAFLLIALPAVVCAWLVKQNAVNVPHFDDFTFSEDWLNYKRGTLTLDSLFSVHLEHRVTVPRLIALGAHILGGADLRWQNAVTLLLLAGTLWNLMVIWRRSTGLRAVDAPLPLFLISMVLFCAVQWQPLLWAILFEIFVSIFCFTLALRLWSGPMKPWTALAWSVVLCAACMLSFGNGPLAWLLVPPAIWLQRPDLPRRTHWRLTGVWLVCLAITLALYFRNFHNSVPPQFAYNFDEHMTARDTIGSSLQRILTPQMIPKAAEFAFTVLGGHLCRGLHLNNLMAAQWIGGISVALLVAALAYLLRHRRDRELIRSAAPWVLIALFSTGSGALITLGRIWLTKSGTVALLPRYVSHSVPLTISLIALAWIIGRRLAAGRPALRQLGALAGGAFLCLVTVEWIYGARMMDQWRNARLQNRAMLMFSGILGDKQFLGPISGDGGYGAQLMLDLDRIGQSPVPILKDARLDHFHISRLTLRHRQAGFNALHEAPRGRLRVIGFSELPSQRPADLVLFTTPDERGAEQIFGLTWPLRLPNFLHTTSYKDHDGLYMDEIDQDAYARWQGDLGFIRTPPRGAPIKAWALDAERGVVYRIPDNRTTNDPLPPLPPEPSDP